MRGMGGVPLGAFRLSLPELVLVVGLTVLVVTVSSPTKATVIRRLLVIVFGALLWSSPFEERALTNYADHMVDHLVVLFLLAPLLARDIRVRCTPVASVGAFMLLTVVLPLYHLTSLGGWVMRYSQSHDVELFSFLIAGVLFWLPVYGPGSTLTLVQRLTYVALASPIAITTGLVLWSATSTAVDTMRMPSMHVTVSDVQEGGRVMLLVGGAAMVVHLMLAVLQLWRGRSVTPVGALPDLEHAE